MASEDEKKAEAPAARRWCIAVDGSHAAHNAFLTCLRLASPKDFIQVIYASDDARKDYLPEDLKGKHIRETYEYPEDQYSVDIVDRKGRSARDAVCGFIDDDDADFDVLVVGCVGRKGPKLDPTILGQTADASLRGAHCTSIIARKPPPAKEALYIVGVDGSDRAQQGVDFALSVARQGDNVMLVHIEEDNKEDTLPEKYHTANIVKRYQGFCDAESENKETANVELRVLDRPRGDESVADILNTLAHDENAAMVVIGVDGLRNFVAGKVTGWGSVSDRLVRNARQSICCIQDKGAIYSK